MEKYLRILGKGDRVGLTLIRLSIAIVFIWIGLLKFVPYEADSITPFVANSPVMSFFYEHPEEYKQHLTHEGEFKPQAREHVYVLKWPGRSRSSYRFAGAG